ncbi:MAG: cyclic nucleotide-binding domain-containing protein [Acetobacterales bacterium]
MTTTIRHRDDYYNQLERRLFLKGSHIFLEGGQDTDVFIIESGSVEIFKGKGEGRTSLARLGPNAIFGEMALVTGQGRSASAVALRDTTCFVIREREFRERLNNGARIGHSLMRVLTDTITSSTSRILEQSAQISRLKREIKERDDRIDELQERVYQAEAALNPEVDREDEAPLGPKVVSSKGVVAA